jgi:hypothetical protein
MRAPADRWLPWLLAIGAAACLLPLRADGLSILDDGWLLQPVLRMRAGEILYRDVWTFYAPGIYHLIDGLFALTGPSLVAARTLFAAMVVGAAVLAYRVARRLAPPHLAWLPAAVYVLAPGPWHKAYYGLCTVAGFLLLARALERPSLRRAVALGALAGVTLVTRQDLGVLQLGLLLGAVGVPALRPARFDLVPAGRWSRVARWSLAALGAAALPAAVTAVWYGVHGALPALLEATGSRALAQVGAHPPMLGRMLAPATFAEAPEGRAVGVILLLPLALYALLGTALVGRLRRDGLGRETALRGAILAYACATLSEAYRPLLLLRFLQSALPFYLLIVAGASDLEGWLRARPGRGAAAIPAAAAVAGGAALVALVVFGLPRVKPPLYTGSARMLRYHVPVEIVGDCILEAPAEAEEIRLVRGFFEHVPRGEPVLAVPTLPLYNVLLGRPNPTAFLADHPTGNFVMSAERKRIEARRLLASPARFVIAEQRWYARGGTPRDPFRATLLLAFHPVRGYGSVLILERGSDPAWRGFAERLRRVLILGPRPGDLEAFERFAAAHRDEPLAWRMVAAASEADGDAAGAIDAFHRAAALDPLDVSALERSAALALALGRRDDAAADVARGRAVRDSGALRALSARLGPARGAP